MVTGQCTVYHDSAVSVSSKCLSVRYDVLAYMRSDMVRTRVLILACASTAKLH